MIIRSRNIFYSVSLFFLLINKDLLFVGYDGEWSRSTLIYSIDFNIFRGIDLRGALGSTETQLNGWPLYPIVKILSLNNDFSNIIFYWLLAIFCFEIMTRTCKNLELNQYQKICIIYSYFFIFFPVSWPPFFYQLSGLVPVYVLIGPILLFVASYIRLLGTNKKSYVIPIIFYIAIMVIAPVVILIWMPIFIINLSILFFKYKNSRRYIILLLSLSFYFFIFNLPIWLQSHSFYLRSQLVDQGLTEIRFISSLFSFQGSILGPILGFVLLTLILIRFIRNKAKINFLDELFLINFTTWILGLMFIIYSILASTKYVGISFRDIEYYILIYFLYFISTFIKDLFSIKLFIGIGLILIGVNTFSPFNLGYSTESEYGNSFDLSKVKNTYLDLSNPKYSDLVMTIGPTNQTDSSNIWQVQNYSDKLFLDDNNFELRSIGLWNTGFRTVFGYSQNIPADLYFLISKIYLENPLDLVRNIFTVDKFNLPFTKLLNSNYTILIDSADLDLGPTFNLIDTTKNVRIYSQNESSNDIFLVKNYSSVNDIISFYNLNYKSSNQTLFSNNLLNGNHTIVQNKYNFSRDKLLVHLPNLNNFSKLTIIPIYFSNCWIIDKSSLSAKIIRINHSLTGLLTDEISVVIKYEPDILNVCRWKDYYQNLQFLP